MSAVKESLRSTIEVLSDEEARQVLELIRQLQGKESNVSQTLEHLARDPSFEIPSRAHRFFRSIEPVRGKGIAASRLLAEDRR